MVKQVEKSQNGEIDWLEPENGLITWDNQALPPVYSHMERVNGIEPSSSPWKGDILAVVLHPRLYVFYTRY